MPAAHVLTTVDQLLSDLQAEAHYAEAQHGAAYGASLLHYHDELREILHQAFALHARSRDLSLKKRERAAYEAHAVDIAVHVEKDVVVVREKFAVVVSREAVSKPGARGVFESLVGQSLNKAEIWWDGRIRLGKPTAVAIAARDTRQYRRYSPWVGWSAGAVAVGGATAGVVVPIVSSLL